MIDKLFEGTWIVTLVGADAARLEWTTRTIATVVIVDRTSFLKKILRIMVSAYRMGGGAQRRYPSCLKCLNRPSQLMGFARLNPSYSTFRSPSFPRAFSENP